MECLDEGKEKCKLCYINELSVSEEFDPECTISDKNSEEIVSQ